MLIVLFLPLSSSRFWTQTQSSKCGRPRMFESSSLYVPLYVSLRLSVRLSALFLLCILSVSRLNHLSHPGPLLSLLPRDHETAAWQNKITTEVF